MKSVVLDKNFSFKLGEWNVTKIKGLVKTSNDHISLILIRLEKGNDIYDARFDLSRTAIIDPPYLNYENIDPHTLHELAAKLVEECLDV